MNEKHITKEIYQYNYEDHFKACVWHLRRCGIPESKNDEIQKIIIDSMHEFVKDKILKRFGSAFEKMVDGATLQKGDIYEFTEWPYIKIKIVSNDANMIVENIETKETYYHFNTNYFINLIKNKKIKKHENK